jgi:hypothetical protein
MTEPVVSTGPYRLRIVEMKFMKAKELQDHQGNWRIHPGMQKDAMKGLLDEIGVADGLVAYHSEREGGKLVLINGHMRKGFDPEQTWPVLISDLNDDEADKQLLLHDSVSLMADSNRAAIAALADNVLTGNLALRELIRKMAANATDVQEEADEATKKADDDGGPPEMELQPFEHYDYVILFCKSTLDWERLLDFFDIERAAFPTRSNAHWDGKKRKVGVGRVLDAGKAMDALEQKFGVKK